MIALLLACAAPVEPAAPDNTDACEPSADPAREQTIVVRTMSFGRRTDGVSIGFDLDGEVSDADDEDGCYQPDLVDPAGVEGIDNAFSAFIPILESTEGAALEGLLQAAIDSGDMLLLFRLSGVDDWQNDPCVHLEAVQGIGTPRHGTDGVLLSGQTFDIDPTVTPSRIEGLALVDGRVEARGLDLTIPMQIFDLAFELTMHDAAVSFTLDADGGATGYLGGGIDVEYVVSLLVGRNDIDIKDLAISLLRSSADLYPDEAGTCPELSAVLEFGATSAFLFDEPPGDTGL
ncbi:MAG: hypothetical protein Q8P18_17240 [Pseudomonadota bacterium]|nr:hypothetical protein [Pseudomonadota bacterium]